MKNFMFAAFAFGFALIGACSLSPAEPCDNDGDMFTGACEGEQAPQMQDCNDADKAVFPGADEICDRKDNDCNGSIDEDDVCDADGADEDDDGDGDRNNTDCVDDNENIFHGAVEDCFNDVDDDCDGLVDGADNECDPTGTSSSTSTSTSTASSSSSSSGTGGSTGTGGANPGTYRIEYVPSAEVTQVKKVHAWASNWSQMELSCSFASGVHTCTLPGAPGALMHVWAEETLTGGASGSSCYTDPGANCGYKLRGTFKLVDPANVKTDLGVSWNQNTTNHCNSCNAVLNPPGLMCNAATTNCVP